jgi:hypothetical protein
MTALREQRRHRRSRKKRPRPYRRHDIKVADLDALDKPPDVIASITSSAKAR